MTETYWVCEATFSDGTLWRGTCTSRLGVTPEDLKPEVVDKITLELPHLQDHACRTWTATELSADAYRAMLCDDLEAQVYGLRDRWPASARVGVPLVVVALVLAVLGAALPASLVTEWASWLGVVVYVPGGVALVWAVHVYGPWWRLGASS